MHIGGGIRYNSGSRKGAVLVCIYVQYRYKKSPVAPSDGALLFKRCI